VGTLGASVPPKYKLPHTLIEPSCVRTTAFAAIQDDASIVEWGIPDPEDKKAPTDSGYTKIT
jgi:hypothetical protein